MVGCDYRGLPGDGAEIRNPIGASMGVRRTKALQVGGFLQSVSGASTTCQSVMRKPNSASAYVSWTHCEDHPHHARSSRSSGTGGQMSFPLLHPPLLSRRSQQGRAERCRGQPVSLERGALLCHADTNAGGGALPGRGAKGPARVSCRQQQYRSGLPVLGRATS